MFPLTERFSYRCPTFRTSLASPSWMFNCRALRSSQEFFQSKVDPDRSSVNGNIGNGYIRRNGNDHIPLSIPASRDNPDLFDRKPVRDRSVQVNYYCSNLRKLDLVARDWIALELWKYERSKLPIFFESGKPKTAFLKGFPSIMQSTNRSLQDLRMQRSQFRAILLCLWQLVLLPLIAWEWLIRRDNVFLVQRTSIIYWLGFIPSPNRRLWRGMNPNIKLKHSINQIEQTENRG
jgi:hypothetical protein